MCSSDLGFHLFVLRRHVERSRISMTMLRTSITSHLLYLLQHSPSQLLASAQLMYKTKTSVGILPHHKCLAISHLKMLHQTADSHPDTLPCLVMLRQAQQHPHLASIRTIPAQFRRVIVTAEDVHEIAVHLHPFQFKSPGVGGPVRNRLRAHVPVARTLC